MTTTEKNKSILFDYTTQFCLLDNNNSKKKHRKTETKRVDEKNNVLLITF